VFLTIIVAQYHILLSIVVFVCDGLDVVAVTGFMETIGLL